MPWVWPNKEEKKKKEKRKKLFAGNLVQEAGIPQHDGGLGLGSRDVRKFPGPRARVRY